MTSSNDGLEGIEDPIAERTEAILHHVYAHEGSKLICNRFAVDLRAGTCLNHAMVEGFMGCHGLGYDLFERLN